MHPLFYTCFLITYTILFADFLPAEQIVEQKMSEHQNLQQQSQMNYPKTLQQVIDVMKQMTNQFPEMRPMMQAAQLM